MADFLVSRTYALAAIVGLAVSAVVLASLGPASASPAPSRQAVVLGKDSGSVIPGKYFVKLKDNSSVRKHGVAARSRSLASGHSGKLVRIIEGAVQGFSVTMSPERAQKLATEPDVEYVQQEQTYQTQSSQLPTPSWGVDRLDQRRGVNLTYNYLGSAGAGVHAYIIDTGIRNHADIDGRLELGYNAIDHNTNTDDCNGHGTFNAGLVGGTKYGVAKKVTLVPVKVFDCTGTSDSDDPIIAGINWVIANAVKPAVIDLSLASICTTDGIPAPCSNGEGQGIIDAERAAIAVGGITVVTAAGNHNANACFNPVGSYPATINVGATDVADKLWNNSPDDGSNWGSCVDIFAPGANVVSIGGIGHHLDPDKIDPDPMPASGTSMAASHVVGAVALLQGTPKFKNASPAEIAAELDAQSTRGIIQGLPDPTVSNKLLFARPTSPRTGSTVALTRNANGALSIFGTTADNSTTGSTDVGGHMFTGTQVNADTGTWPQEWTKSAGQFYASVAVGTDPDAILSSKIELVGVMAYVPPVSPQDDVFHRQQSTKPGGTGWLKETQLDGPPLVSVALAPNHDRRQMLIGADTHGGLHYSSQLFPANDTGWEPVKTISFPSDAQNVTAAPDAFGRINVFVADTHGVLWYFRQTAPDLDSWTAPTPLADTSQKLLNEITVARANDGRLLLFGTEGDGEAWVRVESGPGAGGVFGAWTRLPAKALFHLSAALNVNGLMVVVGVDDHGDTWQSTQISGTNNTFTDWTKIDGLTLRP
ncbi:S8 family serine peptidase [Kribbella sp. NBC_00359]|uniref:S8 family serine peptidase n=1 Tax=Kribbella sp. NBC_00359 TaxID=2975966 RepID=UPI002E20FF38